MSFLFSATASLAPRVAGGREGGFVSQLFLCFILKIHFCNLTLLPITSKCSKKDMLAPCNT